MMVPIFFRLAIQDFRGRARRPAYAVTLLAAVGLGYLAVPASDSHWVVLQLGVYRGVYNSAYVGMAIALASTLWLSLSGFYIVRNSVARDETTGVGQLLAATPLANYKYFLAKFLSNIFVLTSMLGILAGTAVVMQLSRGESYYVDIVALVQPFFLIALPMMVLTAACALLFELTPVLKTSVGNIVWFCCWLVLVFAAQGPGAPLGGTGVAAVVESLGAQMQAQGIALNGSEFSLGLTYLDAPLHTFTWAGFVPSTSFLLSRVALVGIGLMLALLPLVWFIRFDPVRLMNNRLNFQSPSAENVEHHSAGPDKPASKAFLAKKTHLPHLHPTGPLTVIPRVILGEIRILLQGCSPWWWLGAAAITMASFIAPLEGAIRLVLPLAWIWPLVLWSRLGSQRHEQGVDALLSSYPNIYLRLASEWFAGVTLTALTGLAVAIRMMIAYDFAGLAAWLGGVLFIPSLALLLGSLSKNHRLFQAMYLPLWYALVSGLPLLDFMGALRLPSSAPAGPSFVVVLSITLVMLATTFPIVTRRPIKT